MRTILLFGAGKSATVLIEYLLDNAAAENWKLQVVDADTRLATSKVGNSLFGEPLAFDIENYELRNQHIQQADIVISLLPPAWHFIVAKNCVAAKKNLLTASYIDENIRQLQSDIEKNKLFFLCEMGLDPGIDHMSAMKLIDEIRNQEGEISSFKSHCGGLVAPESDNNPWHYKISWNTKSVVMAGKAGATYQENGMPVNINYDQLFKNRKEIEITGLGSYDWYPNRDSMSYATLYGLQQASTFIRTTLRHPNFMKGWNQIVQLRLTDELFLYDTKNKSLKSFYQDHFQKYAFDISTFDKTILEQLQFLGLDDDETIIGKDSSNAADVMQLILENKLSLLPQDKDMIVMKHELEYKIEANQFKRNSTLVVKGENNLHTAMAKTVGLPLGIAARLILNGEIKLDGLHIPTHPKIYLPVLKELEKYGIEFQEEGS